MNLKTTTWKEAEELAQSILHSVLLPDREATSRCGYRVLRATNESGIVCFFSDSVEIKCKTGEVIQIQVLEGGLA